MVTFAICSTSTMLKMKHAVMLKATAFESQIKGRHAIGWFHNFSISAQK